ncbi:hypothetical protein EK21DRAFT_83553 [Setomelanomma holmii]|uniref:Heterokaryon incompatibility domain-containing protein n=1 Tax=Setomelanomma holmii TaxID=210430 RepID=A0A9P4LTE5_9PLEO|nr:hypothetical protein EK21DRAFT_83553 [Setomelanomma holmii]
MSWKQDDKWLRARIDSILELFANEWFEKVWVVQEFVTARRVVVNYGKHSFDWRQLAILTQMVVDEEVPEVAQCLISGGNQSGIKLKSWVRRPDWFEHWRDKVFALIGFSKSAKRLSGLIDYTLPKDEILLAIANDISGHGNLMETFPFAGLSLLPTHTTHLPSWVADWTLSRDIDPIVARHDRTYNASKEECPFVQTDLSRRGVSLHGFSVDIVKEVSVVDLDFTLNAGTLQSNPELIDKVFAYFSSAMHLAQLHCTDPYQLLNMAPVPLYEAVSRTLIGDAIELRQPMMWNYHNLVPRFLHHAPLLRKTLDCGAMALEPTQCRCLSYAGHQPEPTRELHVHAPSEAEPDPFDQRHRLLRDLERARWLCGGRDTRRKFGVTETGFMCMLPRTAVAGDVVCILYGAKVPMILRKMPSAETYQLVGEAYVHGIMEGQGCRVGGRRDLRYVELWRGMGEDVKDRVQSSRFFPSALLRFFDNQHNSGSPAWA